MGVIKKEIPPPQLKENEIVTALIDDIIYPVDSVYKDAEGNPRKQMDFHLKLEGGYPFHAYVAFYKRPSERSVLGALIQHVQQAIGEGFEFETIEDAIAGIRKHGRLFVKVSKFKEWNEKMYPRFKIVPEKLPTKETKQVAITEPPKTADTTKPELTREKVIEQTKNWSEEQRNQYIKYLEDTGRMKTHPS